MQTPQGTTRPTLEQEVEIAVNAIREWDDHADDTDIHGRPVWEGASSLGLDLEINDDGRGFLAKHRGDFVAAVRCERTGGSIHASIRPHGGKHGGWREDAENLAARLPAWWTIDIK